MSTKPEVIVTDEHGNRIRAEWVAPEEVPWCQSFLEGAMREALDPDETAKSIADAVARRMKLRSE